MSNQPNISPGFYKQDSSYEQKTEYTYKPEHGYYTPPVLNKTEKERESLKATVSAACAAVIVFYLLQRFLPGILFEIFAGVISPENSMQIFGDPSFARAILLAVSSVVTLLSPTLLLYLLSNQPKKSFSRMIKPPTGGLLLPSVIITVSLILTCAYALNISGSIFSAIGIRFPSSSFELPYTIPWFIFNIIFTAVIPGIFEELLFRGAIMGSLRRFGDGFALLISSLLFALIHLNFMSTLNAFVLGLALGYFVIRTGSLLTGIIAHFFCNLTVIVLNGISGYLWDIMGLTLAPLLSALLVFIFLAAGLISLKRFTDKTENSFTLLDKPGFLSFYERIKTALKNPVMVFVTGYCVLYILYYVIEASVKGLS